MPRDYKTDLKFQASHAVEILAGTPNLNKPGEVYFFGDGGFYLTATCKRDSPRYDGDIGPCRAMLNMTARKVPDGDLEKFVKELRQKPEFLGFAPVTDTAAKKLEPLRHLDIRERHMPHV